MIAPSYPSHEEVDKISLETMSVKLLMLSTAPDNNTQKIPLEIISVKIAYAKHCSR